MHEYHVTRTYTDCTSVDAESEEEAINLAIDIFAESGGVDDSQFEFNVEKGEPL